MRFSRSLLAHGTQIALSHGLWACACLCLPSSGRSSLVGSLDCEAAFALCSKQSSLSDGRYWTSGLETHNFHRFLTSGFVRGETIVTLGEWAHMVSHCL